MNTVAVVNKISFTAMEINIQGLFTNYVDNFWAFFDNLPKVTFFP